MYQVLTSRCHPLCTAIFEVEVSRQCGIAGSNGNKNAGLIRKSNYVSLQSTNINPYLEYFTKVM